MIILRLLQIQLKKVLTLQRAIITWMLSVMSKLIHLSSINYEVNGGGKIGLPSVFHWKKRKEN